ncbi:MAG: Flp pilus assembly protein CpaB [Clostridia bacterium]|nr:Flp pilus assembly protein CpaB [Clostridia bacterium]
MKKLKILALLAAVIVGLGVYRFMEELSKPQEVPHTSVVVAAVDIPENTQITAEMLRMQSISDDSLLKNYITDPQLAIGMVISSDVYAGEQLVTDRLIKLGETSAAKNTLAYNLEPGMRAITISINSETGLMNFLKPGNRVDLVANYTRTELRPALLDPTVQEEVSIPTAQLLAQNINILAVGTVMNKDGAAEYSSVTLEVTMEDALNINAVSSWGDIRLLLRSPLDNSTVEAKPVDQYTIYPQN